MTTPNLQLVELSAGQSSPHVPHNQALRQLDAIVQLSVIAIDTTPPVSPVDGDVYIVDSTGTGAWTGHGGELAYYVGANAAWTFVDPAFGWLAFVQALDSFYYFTSGSPGGWQLWAGGGGGSDAGFTLTGGTWSTAQDYNFSSGSEIQHEGGAQYRYCWRVRPTVRSLYLAFVDTASPGQADRSGLEFDGETNTIYYGWGGDPANSWHVFRGIGAANYWDASDATVTSTGCYIAEELAGGAGNAHVWGNGEVDFASPDRIVFRALDNAFAPAGDYLAAERAAAGGGITKVTLGNLTDNAPIVIANQRASTPTDTLNVGEAMFSIVDTGAAWSLHIRYRASGGYKTGSVNLT